MDVEHTKAQLSDVRVVLVPSRVSLAVPTASPMDAARRALNIATALVAAVERVQALHTPVSLIVDGKPYGTLCRECTDIDIVNAWECDDGDPGDGYIEHPCPTIRALETP